MEIPDILKTDINDFIRIGKRLTSQEQRIIDPLKNEMHRLKNKIFKEFSKIKTKHFHIGLRRDDRSQYLFKYNDYWWPLHFHNGCISFQSLFSDPEKGIKILAENIKKNSLKEELLSEYNNYILSLKKAVALDFFKYCKVTNQWRKFVTSYNKKRALFQELFWSIEKKWDEIYELEIGTKVKYHGKGDIILEGTVYGVAPDHVYTIIIADKSGRKIIRSRYSCIYDNNPEDSGLHEGLKKLFWEKKIPDMWKENKLDFYD